MSDITRIIKQLGSDLAAEPGAAPLINPADMRAVFAEVLDGGAAELELGALMAMCSAVARQRHRELYIEILLGLLDAVRERVVTLAAAPGEYRTVVLPNYGDRDTGNAVPLIALKLQRLGIRVLVHGALETSGGLANCSVFREFGVLPVATRGQAELRLAENGLALVPTSLISPGLAAMMALKSRLGFGTPAHILAGLLMPLDDAFHAGEAAAGILQIANVPAWLESLLADDSAIGGMPALVALSGATCFGHLENRPRMVYKNGRYGSDGSEWQTLFDAEAASRSDASRLLPVPADVRGFAAWARQRLEGKLALPVPVVHQLACCIYGAGYVQEFNQAKAVAAVEAGSLAA